MKLYLKTKFPFTLTFVGIVWILAMAVLLGVPLYHDSQTSLLKAASLRHRKEYLKVRALRDQALALQSYASDKPAIVLTVKRIFGIVPHEITLSQLTYYGKDHYLALSGLAHDALQAYHLKQLLADMKDEAGNRTFSNVILGPITSSKDHPTHFKMTAKLPDPLDIPPKAKNGGK